MLKQSIQARYKAARRSGKLPPNPVSLISSFFEIMAYSGGERPLNLTYGDFRRGYREM